MCDALVKDLRTSLTKLTKLLNKEKDLPEPAMIELKEIIQEIISLTSNIDSFVECLKAKKDPKVYDKLKRQQEIQEKIFKQFMPLIVACNIMMSQEDAD